MPAPSRGYLVVVGLADELIAMEHEGWDALVAGRGGVYYRERLAADAVMAFPFGVLTREATITAMESSPPWQRYEISEPRVVQLGPDSGIVVYEVVAHRPGQPSYAAVISSTFVRAGDGWKLAFHQQSPRA